MATKHNYLLIVLSFFLLTFSPPSEPCVKVNKITPSHLNSWSDTEKREYIDCSDTAKYYLRMYEKEVLTVEGNIIHQQKEGIWKYYLNGKPWYEKLYYHDKGIKTNSFDGDWTQFIINDSLSYKTEYLNGKLQTGGLTLNRQRFGVWEISDSSRQLKSYGRYTPESICDTITKQDTKPPYMIYDTVVCYQRKDNTWFYFDTKNKLIKIEIYNKGKLVK